MGRSPPANSLGLKDAMGMFLANPDREKLLADNTKHRLGRLPFIIGLLTEIHDHCSFLCQLGMDQESESLHNA